jgi:hypothetical protein
MTKEQCFLAAFNIVVDHLREVVSAAAAEEADWPHQVIAAVRATLGFFAANQDLARLCLLESVSATPTIAVHFRQAVLAAASPLAQGREELTDADSLLPDAESAILGGMVSLAQRAIVVGEADKLADLLPDLTEFALSPYLGLDRALELAAETRKS